MNNLSHFLDEVYSRLTPDQLYEGLFQHDWHKSRDRWRGKCPWHQSKSGTAFYLNPNTLMWRCPQCQVGGGPVQYFHQVMGGAGSPRGKDFIDVAKFLADTVGMEFPDRELTSVQQQHMRKLESRRDMLATVIEFCHHTLVNESTIAIEYLKSERGFTTADIENLRLGIFPSGDRIAELLKSNFDLADAEECGLVYKRNDGNYGSQLSGYITIPWNDEYGRPLTLYGRWHTATPPKGKPKTTALRNPGSGDDVWLRSKRSPLYLDRALAGGHKDLVVVEGVFDAALLHAKGDSRVIAWVAANPSEDQIATLVQQKIKSVTFCLDPDGAGAEGTENGIRRLAQVGITPYAAPVLPDSQDPDAYAIQHGIESWNEHIDRRQHGFRYVAQQIVSRLGKPYTDAKLNEAIALASEFAAALPDSQAPNLDLFFWSELREQLGVKELTPIDPAILRSAAPNTGSSNLPPKPCDKEYGERVQRSRSEEKLDARALAERLKLDIQIYLNEPDPTIKLLLRGEICSNYRISKYDFTEQVTLIEKAANPSAKTRFDGAEFFAQQSNAIDWLIPRYVPVAEAVLVAADPGAGKSALVTDATHAVLEGGLFLGERAKQGKVLYIGSDESQRSLGRRMTERGIDLLALNNLKVWLDLDITNLHELEKLLENWKPSLVIVDSITSICMNVGVSEKDPEFARYIYKLKGMVNRYNAASIFIHHSNKDPLAKGMQKVSGTNRIPAAFWGVFLLEGAYSGDETSPVRALKMVKARDTETFKVRISFQPRHQWMQNGIFEVIEDEEQNADVQSKSGRLLDYLRSIAPHGAEYAELHEQFGWGKSVYKFLDRLEERHQIGRRRSESDRRKWVYFALTVPDCEAEFGGDSPPLRNAAGGIISSNLLPVKEKLVTTQVEDLSLGDDCLPLDESETLLHNPGTVPDCEAEFGVEENLSEVSGKPSKTPLLSVTVASSDKLGEEFSNEKSRVSEVIRQGEEIRGGESSLVPDASQFAIGDRVFWQGQRRQIESFKTVQGSRLCHLGLNQWAKESEIVVDDGTADDAIKMLSDAIADRCQSQASAFKQMIAELPKDFRSYIWNLFSVEDQSIARMLLTGGAT